MAATGACVRPSILKVQGGNILSIANPGVTEVLKRPSPSRANEVTGSKRAAEDSGAKEPSRKQVEEEGAKNKAAENKKVEEKKP